VRWFTSRRKATGIGYLIDSGPYPVRVDQARLSVREAPTHLTQTHPGLSHEQACHLITTAHDRAAAAARKALDVVECAERRADGSPLYRVSGSEPRSRAMTIRALETEYRCTTAEAQQLVDEAACEQCGGTQLVTTEWEDHGDEDTGPLSVPAAQEPCACAHPGAPTGARGAM